MSFFCVFKIDSKCLERLEDSIVGFGRVGGLREKYRGFFLFYVRFRREASFFVDFFVLAGRFRGRDGRI